MVPDLAVLAPGWVRAGELHLDPPPLLVVEVASPSTRRADRGRKLTDYRLGGAPLYLLVDLPSPGQPGTAAVFEAHDFANDRVATAPGGIELTVAGRPLRFDLTDLAPPTV